MEDWVYIIIIIVVVIILVGLGLWGLKSYVDGIENRDSRE